MASIYTTREVTDPDTQDPIGEYQAVVIDAAGAVQRVICDERCRHYSAPEAEACELARDARRQAVQAFGQEIPLAELEASFQRLREPGSSESVEDLKDAHGVMFLCPKCFVTNGGRVGTHSVLCWFSGRGVPDDEAPGPGRWEAVGTGLHDLELRAGSSSILLQGGCNWHGWIRGGKATV